ncbi:LysR family transcriptional regulator [Rhizobium sp. CSW-27]|uniref:LysR family transcriptional regulator n=1 Tax=Rhizobium sp. CSW-27 TaxID=2839985 RepID=UPI001C02007C|nr:LysR family transcriptional regulator [Rhizobium sp. CSW-27]MBT9368643.1 LysR family transcriptional regulator [Rhizobium sp. CSW-27]
MSLLPRSSLEHWGVLRAIVEEGSFAAAAERLNRSQSSVSYAVARLHEAVGVELLSIQGRRAALTEAGAMLLAEVTPLLDDLMRVERLGKRLEKGGAVAVRLLVDTLFSRRRLFAALSAFSVRCPDAEVHLTETVRWTIEDTHADAYDVGVLVAAPGQRRVDIISHVDLIAVAHAQHPLHALPSGLRQAALARFPCVEVRGLEANGGDVSPQGRIWRMNTMDSAIDAVRNGLCFGWLPLDAIREDLERGTLRSLPIGIGQMRPVLHGLCMAREDLHGEHPAAILGRLLREGDVAGNLPGST